MRFLVGTMFGAQLTFSRWFATSKSMPASRRPKARTVSIILLRSLPKTGTAGSIVSVRPGYMRNVLYPKKKAVYAVPDNIRKYDALIKSAQSGGAEREDALRQHREKMFEARLSDERSKIMLKTKKMEFILRELRRKRLKRVLKKEGADDSQLNSLMENLASMTVLEKLSAPKSQTA